MLNRRLLVSSSQLRILPTRLTCTPRPNSSKVPQRFFSCAPPLQRRRKSKTHEAEAHEAEAHEAEAEPSNGTQETSQRKKKSASSSNGESAAETLSETRKNRRRKKKGETSPVQVRRVESKDTKPSQAMSLKEAMLQGAPAEANLADKLRIQSVNARDLEFTPIDIPVPPIPMLSYGLDRVLFNPGVYRLQDPRSRVYNFDPYLEKIMKVNEFDFSALEEYKTSSQDVDLLAMTKRLGTKFTGSTSSMSGILQHFHFLLSDARELNHEMLSRSFPNPSSRFSKITMAPTAAFLRWKNGIYAIDADKSYDTPNIMSWLGNSLEKLLTVEKDDFERYRKSNPEKAPEEIGGRCFHYSSQGNFLMRSQLDAVDPRLPGSGVFDLKTRAVVSIRMDSKEYEKGSGYQLRYDHGEWESFEREFYDMTRATMLKYSLQVRMGRMDGIFVAYHNIERIFGFQYLSLSDLDRVLHGQSDTCLGDQEFRFSIHLLDEVLQKAIEKFPEQTLRFHFLTKTGKSPFMYIFAEPVTDAQADEIQATNKALAEQFEREVVGVGRPGSEEQGLQAEWQNIQHCVDEEVKDYQVMQSATESEESKDMEESENSEKESDRLEEESQNTEEDGPIEKSQEKENEFEDEKEIEEEPDATVEDVVARDQASKAKETPKAKKGSKAKNTSESTSNGPLAGWTLAIRNKVNGKYVKRPENLTPYDNWSVEYHLNELPKDGVWSLYDKVKTERAQLIGEQKKSDEVGLQFYRNLIHKYSVAGREWRNQQDEIENEMGQTVYEPFGPGSPKYKNGEKEGFGS